MRPLLPGSYRHPFVFALLFDFDTCAIRLGRQIAPASVISWLPRLGSSSAPSSTSGSGSIPSRYSMSMSTSTRQFFAYSLAGSLSWAWSKTHPEISHMRSPTLANTASRALCRREGLQTCLWVACYARCQPWVIVGRILMARVRPVSAFPASGRAACFTSLKMVRPNYEKGNTKTHWRKETGRRSPRDGQRSRAHISSVRPVYGECGCLGGQPGRSARPLRSHPPACRAGAEG